MSLTWTFLISQQERLNSLWELQILLHPCFLILLYYKGYLCSFHRSSLSARICNLTSIPYSSNSLIMSTLLYSNIRTFLNVTPKIATLNHLFVYLLIINFHVSATYLPISFIFLPARMIWEWYPISSALSRRYGSTHTMSSN